MASGLQLSRADLLEAYRRMRLIREFEDRVHDEFAAGNIPGFVHLYAGEEASGAGGPLACGAALTAKTLKTGGVAVAFYGDGASNQGAILESYNLAKIWNLPVIFVAEDNGYAESTSSKWSVAGSQLRRAEGFAI